MPLETGLAEKLQIIIQGSETFNNPFNNWIRDLNVPYYSKISLVKSGGNVSRYPCDESCKVMPRRFIQKTKTTEKGSYSVEASDGKEDERCFSCIIFPIDIKYLNFEQMETYLENRSETAVGRDLKSHKENEPLYRILTPELFLKKEQEEKSSAIIQAEIPA